MLLIKQCVLISTGRPEPVSSFCSSWTRNTDIRLSCFHLTKTSNCSEKDFFLFLSHQHRTQDLWPQKSTQLLRDQRLKQTACRKLTVKGPCVSLIPPSLSGRITSMFLQTQRASEREDDNLTSIALPLSLCPTHRRHVGLISPQRKHVTESMLDEWAFLCRSDIRWREYFCSNTQFVHEGLRILIKPV